MKSLLRPRIEKFLKKRGLHLFHQNDIPFGTDWRLDIKAFVGEQNEQITALDIGANTGQTMEALVTCFPGAQIFSFEPVRASFEILEMKAASSKNTQAFRIALSDKVGTVVMAADGQSGLNRILQSGEAGRHAESVECTTVDRFLAERNISNLTIMKIDVEGHEMKVLRGGMQAIERGQIEFILCECEFKYREEEPHGNFFGIFEFLSERSYRLVSFYTGGVDQNGWRFGDVLFKLSARDDGDFIKAPMNRNAPN